PFAAGLVQRLKSAPIPGPLALAALAGGVGGRETRREQGAFYTDFRLAKYVAQQVAPLCSRSSVIVDLSAGSGILLAATVLEATRNDRRRAADLVADSICAADLDQGALRACRAVLGSLCRDLDSICKAAPRLRVQDSLIEGRTGWLDVCPEGFDIV